MASTQPSLAEVSEQFLEEQARASDDGTVQTNITDAQVYPTEDGWWITFTCGEPFPEHLARIPLGKSKTDCYERLLEIAPGGITSIEIFEMQTVEIDLDGDWDANDGHTTKDLPSPEAYVEIESPVFINGYAGNLATLPRQIEYQFDKRKDADEIQSTILKDAHAYTTLKTLSGTSRTVRIDSVDPLDARTLEITLGETMSPTPITFTIDLPRVDTITDHPVAEFVQSVGCGKLEHLEDESVYIGQASHETVVGQDTVIAQYGLSATPTNDEEESGFLSRFF